MESNPIDAKTREIMASLNVGVEGPHDWKGDSQSAKYSVNRSSLEKLEGLIVAALREEYLRGRDDMSDEKFEALVKPAYAEGHKRGIEEASKVACEHDAQENGTDVCRAIAERIRALAEKGKRD